MTHEKTMPLEKTLTKTPACFPPASHLPSILLQYTIQRLLATLASPAWSLKQPTETQQSPRPSSSCEWNSFTICPGRKQHFDLNEWQMAAIRREGDYWEGVVYGTSTGVCV